MKEIVRNYGGWNEMKKMKWIIGKWNRCENTESLVVKCENIENRKMFLKKEWKAKQRKI